MDNTVVKPLLLQKSINILENMKHPTKDERPKSEQKLHNVLQKVTDVCFVSSVLNIVFKYGNGEQINISEVDEVRKSDKELDEEIADFALKEGEKQGRKVLVLPCDSNLHISIAARVEDWYSEKTQHFNKDNPIDGIARASCTPHDLETEEVIEELVKHGYIMIDDNRIQYKLPGVNFQLELEGALKRFVDRIRLALGPLSARGHEFFSREIILANGNLQSSSAETIRQYCETQYSEKYSLYRTAGTNENGISGVIRQMEGASVATPGGTGLGSQPESMDAEGEGDGVDILSYGKLDIIPITLTCEAAHVLDQLLKSPRKPETLSDFDEFIRNRCGVIYVVSPKFILSNIIKEGREIPPNFEFSILLGERIIKKPLKFGNLTDVANVLTFPGKEKIKIRSHRFTPFTSRYSSASSYEPMDTSSYDHRRDIFEAFQRHVSQVTKTKAERHRSIPVMMDPDAELRCKERFLNWIKETNSDQTKRLTNDTFTKELIQLSCEFSRLSADDAIKLLVDSAYLEIKDPERSIVYKWNYRKPNVPMANEGFKPFMEYWKTEFNPSDSEDSSVINRITLARKRPATSVAIQNAKRPRVIDI